LVDWWVAFLYLMRHSCSKPSRPQKTFEIHTQIYKTIEKIAKPSSNIAKITVLKDPIEKRVRNIHQNPLKSATSNIHLPNATNPTTTNENLHPKKEINLKRAYCAMKIAARTHVTEIESLRCFPTFTPSTPT